MGSTTSRACLAAQEGNSSAIARLVARGEDLNADDGTSYGWKPVHYAVYGNQPGMVKVLADHGANINVKSAKGYISGDQTALMVAADKGKASCIRVLLDARADVDVKDQSTWQALHYAVSSNHEDCVKLLLDHGANPNAFTSSNKTALDMAADKSLIPILSMLLPFCTDDRVLATFLRVVSKEDKEAIRVIGSSGRIPLPILQDWAHKVLVRANDADRAVLQIENKLDMLTSRQHSVATGGGAQSALAATIAQERSELRKSLPEAQAKAASLREIGNMLGRMTGLPPPPPTPSGTSTATAAILGVAATAAAFLASWYTGASDAPSPPAASPPAPARAPPRRSSGTRTSTAASPAAGAGVSCTSTANTPSGTAAREAPATAAPVDEPATDSASACSVCMDKGKNAALVPCGHLFCFSCASAVKAAGQPCPMCRKPISSVLKVFG
jgi:hypothetical protein